MYCTSTLRRLLSHFLISQGACALTATLVLAGETTNSIGITMIDIPAACFIQGACALPKKMKDENIKRAAVGLPLLSPSCANPDPYANENDGPPVMAYVGAFQMAKTELTLGQFKKFIVASQRYDLATREFRKINDQGDNAPVAGIGWDDIQAFIKWLNSIEGGGYRLPSESEWEYACRAGGNHRYCGSNDIDSVAWFRKNSGGKLHPVGLKQPNAFGLYDMSGNVEEVVADRPYDCRSFDFLNRPTDGSADDMSGENHVFRGGSYESRTFFSFRNSSTVIGMGAFATSRTCKRSFTPPHDEPRGFRVARTLSPVSSNAQGKTCKQEIGSERAGVLADQCRLASRASSHPRCDASNTCEMIRSAIRSYDERRRRQMQYDISPGNYLSEYLPEVCKTIKPAPFAWPEVPRR